MQWQNITKCFTQLASTYVRTYIHTHTHTHTHMHAQSPLYCVILRIGLNDKNIFTLPNIFSSVLGNQKWMCLELLSHIKGANKPHVSHKEICCHKARHKKNHVPYAGHFSWWLVFTNCLQDDNSFKIPWMSFFIPIANNTLQQRYQSLRIKFLGIT